MKNKVIKIQFLKILYLFGVSLALQTPLIAQSKIIIEGIVYGNNGNKLVGATVYDSISKTGTTTNEQGYFHLIIKSDYASIQISYVGFITWNKEINTAKNINLKAYLKPFAFNEVVISGHKNKHKINPAQRPVEMPMQNIEKIPSIIGEPDVLKAIAILPGISQTSDISTNLTVRGASHDQNLMVLDEAAHYQTGHLFGFTSAFSYEAIKDVRFYKNIIPVKYGGRLSSVIELHSKSGSPDSLTGNYSFGLINSGLSLSGPLLSKKHNLQYFVAARSMYLGILTLPLYYLYTIGDANTFVTYYIYDINTNLKWQRNQDEEWSLHIFLGEDNLNSRQRINGSQTRGILKWGTQTGSLKHKKRITSNLFIKSHLTYSNAYNQVFAQSETSKSQELFSIKRTSKLQNYSIKSYLDIHKNQFEINLGFECSLNLITPSRSERKGEVESTIDNGYSYYHVDLFADNLWTITPNWSLYSGLRWSNYLQNNNISSQPEPRLSLHYSSDKLWGIGIGYQRMAQYSFLAPITNLGLPNDIWVSIKDEMLPSTMNQVFINLITSSKSTNIQLEVDLFYRRFKHLNEIINRTSFFLGLPYNWENIIQNDGKGQGYGLESKLDYNFYNISGSLAYTFLKTRYKYKNINAGLWFPGQYDIRHQINLNMSFKLTRKWLITALFDFKSGRPVTVPKEIIIGLSGEELIIYGAKNASRLGLYHRLDIGFQKKYKGKKNGREKTLSFSIFNTYFRYNPFYYTYTRKEYIDNKRVNVPPYLSQFGFAPIIPSIAYSVNF